MGIFDRIKRIVRANLNDDARRFDEILQDSDENLRRLIEELKNGPADQKASGSATGARRPSAAGAQSARSQSAAGPGVGQGNAANDRARAQTDARHRAQVQSVYRAYQVLGLSPSASIEQIKSAYRSLMRQVHPDRVANAGAAEQDQAKKKAQEINLAYEVLAKVRGF